MMMTSLDRDPIEAQRLTESELSDYRQKGYLILRGLLSPTQASVLRTEVLDIMDVIGLGQTKLRQTREYLVGGQLDPFVNSPHLQQIASQLMEGEAHLYLPFTAVKSGGGGGIFNFHQDNQYTRFDGPGINLWFALNAMTADNGCLQIVPRSHLNGTLDSEVLSDGHRKTLFDPSEFELILMEPGDCVAFSRLTVHGSGPNITDAPRVAYAVQYHREDVRATWDGTSEPMLLKDHPRYPTGPVTKITPPQGKLDGH